jgi:hypothetical protein
MSNIIAFLIQILILYNFINVGERNSQFGQTKRDLTVMDVVMYKIIQNKINMYFSG